MNNKYKITVKHPLIRPGITIETSCSEKYLVKAVNTLMEQIRIINESKSVERIGKRDSFDQAIKTPANSSIKQDIIK